MSLFGVDDLSKLSLPIFEENVFSETDELKQRILNIIEYIRGYVFYFLMTILINILKSKSSKKLVD